MAFTNTKFIGLPIPPGLHDSSSTVTIDNPPPITSILIPSSGATLSGTASLDARASDANSSNGIPRVEFHLFAGGLRGTLAATATATQYGWVAYWDTTTVMNNNNYVLQSVAYDCAGNGSDSTPSPIEVHN